MLKCVSATTQALEKARLAKVIVSVAVDMKVWDLWITMITDEAHVVKKQDVDLACYLLSLKRRAPPLLGTSCVLPPLSAPRLPLL